MQQLTQRGVPPSALGLTVREIQQLATVDATTGNNDGVAEVAEYDRFLQTTMRGPGQILPREPWVKLQLQKLHDEGKGGVRIRPAAPVQAQGKAAQATSATDRLTAAMRSDLTEADIQEVLGAAIQINDEVSTELADIAKDPRFSTRRTRRAFRGAIAGLRTMTRAIERAAKEPNDKDARVEALDDAIATIDPLDVHFGTIEEAVKRLGDSSVEQRLEVVVFAIAMSALGAMAVREAVAGEA